MEKEDLNFFILKYLKKIAKQNETMWSVLKKKAEYRWNLTWEIFHAFSVLAPVWWSDLKSWSSNIFVELSDIFMQMWKVDISMINCGGWGDSPGGSVGKESTCDAEDAGLIYGMGRSPGIGNSNPLQYSCLGNPMDRGPWWATVHGVTRVGHDLATKPPLPPIVCVCVCSCVWLRIGVKFY